MVALKAKRVKSFAKKAPPGRRWASLKEIDRRIKIGSDRWKSQPYRVRQLSAWRGDHVVVNHKTVRRFARSKRVKPSSNITLQTKTLFALERFTRNKRKKL